MGRRQFLQNELLFDVAEMRPEVRQMKSNSLMSLSAAPVSCERTQFTDKEQEEIDEFCRRIRKEVTKSGLTLLHRAVKDWSVGVVKYLVFNGANVNVKNKYGTAPLHLANDVGIAEFLVSNGANVNEKNVHGITPLHFAGNSKIAKYLISKGADVNVREDDKGCTPLHIATRRGDVDFVKCLVSAGANVDAKTKSGRTPLHFVFSLWNNDDRSIDIINFLVSAGANVDSQDYKGSTPLHLAAEWEKLNVAQFLISIGADVHVKDKQGMTPLHSVAKYRCESIEIIKYLVANGADVNTKNDRGNTPLHDAANRIDGNVEFMRFLVSLGADVYVKDENDRTPLDIAKENNRKCMAVVECLENLEWGLGFGEGEGCDRETEWDKNTDDF